MKYFKCLNCEFNVTQEDERCPNCGVLHPLESLAEERPFNEQEFTEKVVVGILVVAFLIPAIYFGSQAGFFGVVCCALPVGIIVAYVGAMVVGAPATLIAEAITNRKVAKRRNELDTRKTPHPESLKYKETLINQRLSELSNREHKLESVLQKAKQISGEQWQQVSKTLEATIETLKKQHARYSAKSVEIEIVRLQNRAAPLIYEADRYSYEQIDSHLVKIGGAQTRANELDRKLQQQKSVLGDVSEVKELSERLSEINESMVKLHDALVSRQAVLALQEVSPLSDAITNVPPPIKAIRESEIFNIHVAITDFSASFKELESEYARVQAEEDVAGEVDKIINRAGS